MYTVKINAGFDPDDEHDDPDHDHDDDDMTAACTEINRGPATGRPRCANAIPVVISEHPLAAILISPTKYNMTAGIITN